MPNSTILPKDFVLNTRDDVKPYFDELTRREIIDVLELKQLIADNADLDSYLSEDYARRYIRQSCNTLDKDIKKHYEDFIDLIQPDWAKVSDVLNRKIVDSMYSQELDGPYSIFLRSTRRSIELFKEENIPLQQEESKLSSEYDEIVSKMTIEHNGEELTMRQASKLLKEKDRNLRKEVRDKMVERRSQDHQKIHELLDKLILLRNKIARNCGFSDFADYKHVVLQRFDYTSADIVQFCQSIASITNPLSQTITNHRKQKLGHDLKPYDFSVSVYDKKELSCFTDSADLVDKMQVALNKTHPGFGDHIRRLQIAGNLDLDSRKGKAPGGYNYPLDTCDLSFIFMNAVNDSSGVFTMVHEAGHSLHHKETYGIEPSYQRNPGSEVAEIASMGQELLSLDNLGDFFPNGDDYLIAKLEKIEDDIQIFPWIAKIDLFQKRLYSHEGHTHEQRNAYRMELSQQYPYDSGGSYESSLGEYETALAHRRQNQMHIFDVPLYYIEYGIASLAAIAMRKNYLQNPEQGIQNYINLLKIGNTKTMPEIFETGGIKFDFSKEYIQELMSFMQSKLEEYYAKLS